ncbi:protease inhibitor I42 family protein [Rhodosalinus sp.]|uniref:protease inhibitor I42 family protein n=1 Tax=Rhodosalinus sp. TaxID=2047741 RepID=UPI00397A713E
MNTVPEEALRLGPGDGGRSVAVPAGAEVVLDLPENPTTGFRWSLPEGEGLTVIEDRNVGAGDGIGAGGARVLRLRVSQGRHAIRLVRSRPGAAESGADATFEVELVAD